MYLQRDDLHERYLPALEDARSADVSTAMGGRVRSIVDFLDRVTYRVMNTEEELDQVFQLRYESYRHMGLIGDLRDGRWSDRHDADPSYRNFGVFVDGALMGAIRVNVLSSGSRDSMALEMYPETLGPMVDAGCRIVEASRFCHSMEAVRRHPALTFATIRVVALAAVHHRCTHLTSSVRREHLKFYERIVGARPVEGSDVPYKGHSSEVNVSLFVAAVSPMIRRAATAQQYFLASRGETDLLFSKSAKSIPIRPTAADVLLGAPSMLETIQ
jgi:hypothetical protein